MGWLSAFNKAAKATVKVACLPVAVTADVCGLSIPRVVEGGQTFTGKLIDGVKDDAGEILEKLDEE